MVHRALLCFPKGGGVMACLSMIGVARMGVRVGDINYGGHMGNDKALLAFHDARLAYLEALGFSEGDIGGAGIIMRDAYVLFHREVWRRDVLVVDVGIEDVRNSSFTMTYTVRRESDDEVVFTGRTVLVAFDYGSRRPVRVPEVFREKIGA